jgi:hypothetical protein
LCAVAHNMPVDPGCRLPKDIFQSMNSTHTVCSGQGRIVVEWAHHGL